MRKITKRAAAIATVAVVGVGALGATAYASGWFQTTAEVKVSTATAKKVTGEITFTTPLYPTGKSDVKFKLANPNDYKLKITEIKLTGNIGSPGCNPGNSGITFDPPNIVLASKATEATYVAAGIAHMSEFSDGACEGITDGTTVIANITGIPTSATATTPLP